MGEPAAGRTAPWRAQGVRLFPGLFSAGLIALAAQFVSEHHNAPAMLMALLFGIAMNFLGETERCQPGIDVASRTVLRIGVALLGARISAELVASLGWSTLAIILSGVVLTIAVGLAFGRLMGKDTSFSLLTAGAVAICGASAAMAISAALPRHKDTERDLIFTVFAVTALSTFAMILYPILTKLAGMDEVTAGVFLGTTIHDVAQVVGAGFTVSETTGDTATLVKLIRVALLAPVVILIALLFRQKTIDGTHAPVVPLFVIGFAALATANSLGWLSPFLVDLASAASRWALLTAIAAVGMKTSLGKLTTIGWRSASVIVTATVFLAAYAGAALLLAG